MCTCYPKDPEKSVAVRDHGKHKAIRIKVDSESNLIRAWIQDPSSKICRKRLLDHLASRRSARIKLDSESNVIRT